MRRRTAWSTLVFITGMAANAFAAPLSYTGGVYTQDFNGLPTSDGFFPPATTLTGRGPHDFPTSGSMASAGMNGWTLSNFGGSSSNTEYRAHAGELAGSNGRGVVSFGPDNSNERALGVLATSNQISRFGVAFVNNSGMTLNQIALDFVGEQWRRGNVASPGNSLTYAYAVTTNALDTINTNSIFTTIGSFTSPNTQTSPTEVAIDGNAPLNQVPVSVVVSGVNWTPGSTLLLRWTGQDLSGQDDGLAIDNFRFSAQVPEPASASLLGLAMLGLVGRLRCRK